MRASNTIDVAVGLLFDADGKVLVAQRPEHVHQGGKWEFPGGKVHADESPEQALQRELLEELGVQTNKASFLMRCQHEYSDCSIVLHVFRIIDYEGDAVGMENQPISWVYPADLTRYEFPDADKSILDTLLLPDIYAITPSDYKTVDELCRMVSNALERGISLLQFRNHSIDDTTYIQQAIELSDLCHSKGARLILNRDPSMVEQCGAHGVHLASKYLKSYTKRPLPENYIVAASCHNEQELKLASGLGASFVLISPVKKTASHPDSVPLGWEGFKSLKSGSGLPAYALGGMSPGDCAEARCNGAVGVAMIRGVWGTQDIDLASS
jgi:8-oxo-dGTP diphosphatase